MDFHDVARDSGLDIILTTRSDRLARLFSDEIHAFCASSRPPRSVIALSSNATPPEQAPQLRRNHHSSFTYLVRNVHLTDDSLSTLRKHTPDVVIFDGIQSPNEAQAAIDLALCGTRVIAVADDPAYALLSRQPFIQHVLSRVRFDDPTIRDAPRKPASTDTLPPSP